MGRFSADSSHHIRIQDDRSPLHVGGWCKSPLGHISSDDLISLLIRSSAFCAPSAPASSWSPAGRGIRTPGRGAAWLGLMAPVRVLRAAREHTASARATATDSGRLSCEARKVIAAGGQAMYWRSLTTLPRTRVRRRLRPPGSCAADALGLVHEQLAPGRSGAAR